MDLLLLVVGSMLAAVVLVGVGDRLRLPWPVLLVVLAAAAAFVPGVDAPDIDPELILPLLLPPLLYATAQRASWSMFRTRWRAVVLLAVGLVLTTVTAVAGTVLVLVPGIALGAAVAIGAAVAPPDPVAVEAVAGPLRVPRRLVATLQAEGLFNDATALVVYQTALAAVVVAEAGPSSPLGGVLRFGYGLVVAVLVGFVAARLARWGMDRLTDTVAPSALTLVLPFAVYLAADELGASGVIAVVVTALQMRQRADADASELRLSGRAFWDVVEMLVTAAAFTLVGLELRQVLGDAGDELGRMLAHAGVVAAVVVVLRTLWMLVAVPVVRRRDDRTAAPRSVTEAVVLTWAGMRGLATIALALGLPRDLPGRAELLVIAAMVLVVTLVLPGFTLPVLLRVLGVREDDEPGRDAERALARRARRAALDELRGLDPDSLGLDEDGEPLVDALRARLAHLTATLSSDDVPRVDGALDAGAGDPDAPGEDYADRLARLRRRREQWSRMQAVALAAARREVVAARAEAGADPTVVDRVLRRLDVRTLALPPE